MRNFTTPFPSIPGSPTSKTEDRFFCRDCQIVDYADHIEATGALTCAWCDSERIVDSEVRARELREERDATHERMDREADERRATYTEGCLTKRQAS